MIGGRGGGEGGEGREGRKGREGGREGFTQGNPSGITTKSKWHTESGIITLHTTCITMKSKWHNYESGIITLHATCHQRRKKLQVGGGGAGGRVTLMSRM